MMILIATLASLAVAQDPSEPAPDPCALNRVEEKDGAFTASFACAWPKGTSLRLEIQLRTTHISWVPWLEKLSDGKEVERVNLSVRDRGRTLHRDIITLKEAGTFSVAWKPAMAGIYHLQIVYDPFQQKALDGRSPQESRTTHRVLFLKPGQAEECLVDDGARAIRDASEFFQTLRAALEGNTSEEELYERMNKHVDAAIRRRPRSHHQGTYSLLEVLSPYVTVEGQDPAKAEKDKPPKLIPNMLDIKTARVPPGVVRESMMLALMWMEDALKEAALLAPLPEGRDSGSRRTSAVMVGEELIGAVKRLKKLEGAAQVEALRRKTKFDDLMTRANECIKHMLDKRKVDEGAMKELLEGLASAALAISHPVESLKE